MGQVQSGQKQGECDSFAGVREFFAGIDKCNIAVVGQDKSGKTKFLEKLCLGEIRTTVHGDRIIETVSYKNIQVTSWSVCYAGQMSLGPETRALILVIDGQNADGFRDQRQHYCDVIRNGRRLPTAILINKADRGTLVSKEEVIAELRLRDTYGDQGLCNVAETSFVTGHGVASTLGWLSRRLAAEEAGGTV